MVRLYGVVPDGVSEVSVESASTGSVEVAVSDNVYVYAGQTAQEVKSVRYVTASGKNVRLPIPL